MKYIIEKEVEANDAEEALRKSKRKKVVRIREVPKEDKKEIGY